MEKIRIKGGLSANWEGRPAKKIEPLFTPSHLRLPLRSPNFHFSDIRVQDGDRVVSADVLAVDANAFNVPLLAPLGGTVSIEKENDKPVAIRLSSLDSREAHRDVQPEPPPHVAADTQHLALRRRFLQGGGWPLVHAFPSNSPLCPETQPDGVIISCVKTEPFRPRGFVLLENNLREFVLGLESLQKMVGGYEKIYLIVGHRKDETLAAEIQERCRGYAWLQTRLIEPIYPYDHPGTILQNIGATLHRTQPYWHLSVESILAIHRILVVGQPVLSRTITLGGPGVQNPGYIRAYPGTPLKELLAGRLVEGNDYRIIKGGVFTGREANLETDSLDIEDDAVNVVPAGAYRQMLGFFRPGFQEHSVTRAFLSSVLPLLPKKMTTRLEGEGRACIQCNSCENVCPIPHLMPYLYHRFQPLGMIDEMEKAGIWNCIECGCCSYVCPSKIPLLDEIRLGKKAIIEDMEEMEED